MRGLAVALPFMLACGHPVAAAPPLPVSGPVGGERAVDSTAISRAEVPEGEQVRIEGRRYVDPRYGFEITRPDGDWLFAPGQPVVEGISVPVIVAHPGSGAQVVVQVAPAVATPAQLARRLTEGLRARPGFVTGAPAPLQGTDEGVGFRFTLGDAVAGRVAILPGRNHVYVLLATWPRVCPISVVQGIDGIVRSMRIASPPG